MELVFTTKLKKKRLYLLPLTISHTPGAPDTQTNKLIIMHVLKQFTPALSFFFQVPGAS